MAIYSKGAQERQNAVRKQIKTASGKIGLYVNPKNAPYTHKGLNTVQLKKGSSFQEEESDYQHITTAIGYMVAYDNPVVKPQTKRSRLI